MSLHTEMSLVRQFPESDTTGGVTKDTESSNGTAAQGQNQSSGKPIGSAAAKFQIRSAKTLQFRPTSQKVLEDKSQTARESNKSKSLDWRGTGTRTGYNTTGIPSGNTTGIPSGTQNFGQSFIRRADSLDRKEVNNKITPYAEENQPKSPPWRTYNVSGQVDRKVYPIPGSTPRVTLAMEQAGSGQSLPGRLKPRFRQGSIGDSNSLWGQVQQGESSSDQIDHRIGCWAKGQMPIHTDEVTGNQTIRERINKLYGASSTDTKSNANPKDLTIEKPNCTSDFDYLNSDTMNSIQRHRKSSTDSPSASLSPSDSQQRKPSYTVEKAGTFPRWISKNEQTFFNQIPKPSTLDNRNDQRDSSSDIFSKPKWSMETSSSKKNSHLPSGNEETRSPELCSQSLEITRNKFSETAQSSGQKTHSGMVIKSSSDGSLNISNQSVKRLATISGSINIDIKKEEPNQLKYPLASRGGAHSEIHQEDEDISTVKTESGRGDDVQENPQSPSSDSVKNTIHKFEALAQQNKSAPHVTLPRRALSVPEQPKPVVLVKKSDSDINLKFRKVAGNTESQKTNLISKGDASEEPKGNVYFNRTSQSHPTVNVKPTSEQRETYKTSIALIPTKQLHDPKPDHYISTLENKKRTVHNRYIDEPDLAMTPRTRLPNNGAMKQKAGNPTFQSTVFQRSNAISSLKQQSIHVNMDDNDDDDDDTPTNSPNTAPLTINLQSNTRTPAQSVNHSHIGVSTSVKIAANGTPPTAVSNPSQSSASTCPVQKIYSSLNNSNNNNYNATRKDLGTAVTSMARWSSDEEDDDDDDDYEGTDSEDSDSGESSVTVTSNMSQSERKSFSLSFVELCIYGGVEYKPSDGSESGDGDWLPSRSASLSSDISAFSSVTLLSNDELDRLLEDVKGLGDDTLQKYEDVQVVVLHKEVGSGLGFTLAGGVDQSKPVTVHRVIPGGVSAQEGSIFEGDQVLSINGTPLQNSAHWEALRTLRKARSQAMAVVVLQRSNQIETQHRKEATHRPIHTGRRVHVTLNKSSYDLGFSLEGGVDSSSGDKPLTVQRIFQGGPVNQVFPGDELVEVQGLSLMGMRRLEAWNLIKRLPPGPVEVLLHRPHQPH